MQIVVRGMPGFIFSRSMGGNMFLLVHLKTGLIALLEYKMFSQSKEILTEER